MRYILKCPARGLKNTAGKPAMVGDDLPDTDEVRSLVREGVVEAVEGERKRRQDGGTNTGGTGGQGGAGTGTGGAETK